MPVIPRSSTTRQLAPVRFGNQAPERQVLNVFTQINKQAQVIQAQRDDMIARSAFS